MLKDALRDLRVAFIIVSFDVVTYNGCEKYPKIVLR